MFKKFSNTVLLARGRRLRKVSVLSACCIAVVGLTPIFAQDLVGGLQYRLGVSQDLRFRTNPGLNTPSDRSVTQATTNLSLGIATETRTQRLSFDASGSLQVGTGQRARVFRDPSVALAYRRDGASTRLNLDASLRQRRVETLDFVFGEDELGLITVIPTDSSVIQRQTGLRARIEFGRDAPFGGSFGVGQTDTRYTANTIADLVNNRRRNADLALRFQVSPVITLRTGLQVSQLKEEGAAQRQTETFSLGLTLDRPDGDYNLDIRTVRTPDGERYALTLGRQFELPRGALSVQAGLINTVAGNTRMIGSVAWREDLPDGQLTLGLERTVSGDVRDRETESTRLNVGASRTLTPQISGQANMGLRHSKLSGTSESSQSIELSASIRYAVTEDWGLRAGANHRIQRGTDSNTANSTTLFLTLDREFLSQR